MGIARRVMGLLALLCVLVATGCSPESETAGGAHATYDLAGLAALEDAFPEGFLVNVGEVSPTDAAYVGLVGTTVSSGESFTVDPAQCRALLKPVEGTVGANEIGIRADGPGPDEQTISVAVVDRVTVPDAVPTTGCDQLTFDVEGAVPDGTAVRLPSPDIAGAVTAAFKVHYGPGAQPHYYYMALLDGRVYVQLHGQLGPGVEAQTLLPDLLTKAVAAISEPQPASSSAPTRAGGVGQPHVARLSQLADQFPPGFVAPPFRPGITTHQFVDQVGAVVSYGAPFSVAPPQCQAMLKPVDGRAGAAQNGTRASGSDNQWITIGADYPVSVAAAIPATGCDLMTYHVDDDRLPAQAGTAERIAAPEINGATTLALRIMVDGYPQVDYFYAAILDDGAMVDVGARLNPNAPEAQALSDLLSKAVAAVRGD